ncbi:DUF4097 family beta strand repeat-containing protein [Streptomyces sp. NPDC006798]|uniref:DUF4097 family beta strand repeat-containing protein n=1 Tax=Streptomyces sp. NPDC006798 TaxID=3155462 RepID=UPI0033CDDC78
MTSMTSTQLAHQNAARIFLAEVGPVLADITCPDGAVRVVVDPDATAVRVEVTSGDPDGPAAEAVRRTRIHQSGARLTVVVPPTPPTAFTGVSSGVVVASGNVRIDGLTFTNHGGGIVVSGSAGAEVLVVLPAGSSVTYTGASGSIRTAGVLAGLTARTTSGSVAAETVGRMNTESSSGSITAGTVTERVDISASSGSIKIGDYRGADARIRTTSGSITLTASPAARGRITARAVSGSVRLCGTAGRDDLVVRASAVSGTVRTTPRGPPVTATAKMGDFFAAVESRQHAWPAGQKDLHWHLLFDQRLVHEALFAPYRTLTGQPGLEPVPARWAHCTILHGGPVDQYRDGEIDAITERVAKEVRDSPAFDLVFDRPTIGTVAVECAARPGAPARHLWEIAAQADAEITGFRFPRIPFVYYPHLSLAYGTAHPVRPDRRELKAMLADLPGGPVTLRATRLALVAQSHDRRHITWTPLAEIPLQ